MKLNKILFTLLAVFSILAVSCQVEEQTYEPGELDLEGCYGVYFPTQEAAGAHSFDPSDTRVIEFSVMRTTEDGDITVPVKVSSSEENVFEVPELKFVDGQTEAILQVGFPDAQVGVEYSLTLEIVDPQYARIYGVNPTFISCSIIIEKWIEVGEGKYMDYYFSQDMDGKIPTVAPVKILQNESNPAEFKISDPFVNYFFGPNYSYKEKPSDYFKITILEKDETFTPYEGATPVTIPIPDLIWYTNIVTGFVNSNYDDTICYVHPGLGFNDYLNPATWSYNKVLGYQENGLPVAFQLAPFVYMWSVGGWNYAESPIVTILFPGGVLTDYTISLAAGHTQNGKQPVAFTFGPDVETIKYAAYAGPLSKADLEEKTAELVAATDAKTVSKPAADAEGNVPDAIVNFEFDKTGEYTLVAVGCDEAGAAQSSASIVLTYVAADDEDGVPVMVSAGLGSAAKYAPLGLSSETAVEFYVYGEDLVDVKVGLFTSASLVSDQDACVQTLLKSASAPADVVAEINENVYVDVFSGLTPGTEYYLLVWASNGYEQKLIMTDSWTTDGDPLPIYQSFTAADIDGDLLPETSEGYFGTYNYYAQYLGPLREYIGQVTIADSDIPDAGPDDSGLMDEYVEITGLFGGLQKDYGVEDDTVVFDYYGGVIYSLENGLGKGTHPQVGEIYIGLCQGFQGGVFVGYDYLMIGGYIDEGYLAFVTAPSYASAGYTINSFFLYAYQDAEYSSPLGYLDYLTDPLLVDPAVDDNGLAPAPKKSAMSRADLNKINFNLAAEINCVETERGRIRSAIDKMRDEKAVQSVGIVAGVKGEWSAPAAEFTAEEAAPQFKSTTSDFGRVNDAKPALYR